ncbi:Detected protein of unknown function [Hibiscus syriacus]|uniref:Uncharacterized protein n=1 Tax=Hibiscus syriacus TaxID=106335 RepID=A0A6A2XWN5_HIBSY|nr:Detected protein of unknown function [Hibiscus syriacus]
MSSRVSANLVPSQAVNMSKENRHLADYIPNFWGEIFLSPPSEMDMDARTQQEYQELKQQVRRMLVKHMDKPSQKVHIVDAVQRLGVAYHFGKEIEDALQIIYQTDDDDDLCTTAVRFRLLREHGFDVHCDTFNKFKGKNGKFKESLTSDMKGMLELLVARSYISIYEGYGNQDQSLMKFAKLDFNMVQHLHKQQLKEINRWWKGLDVATNFPFARDRLVECYLWINGVYFEPHYSIARTFMTKVASLTSIIDDTYDAYGTPEELELFTEAIHRWDINGIDQLPGYMKLLYSEIINVFKDMDNLMSEQRKSYRVQLAIEAMKQACQAHYTEAKWLHEKYMPTLVEYLSVAYVSCCYPMLTIVSFVGIRAVKTGNRSGFSWILAGRVDLTPDPDRVQVGSFSVRIDFSLGQNNSGPKQINIRLIQVQVVLRSDAGRVRIHNFQVQLGFRSTPVPTRVGFGSPQRRSKTVLTRVDFSQFYRSGQLFTALVGMEDSITKETFIWAFNDPKILRASKTICRLMDDVVGHQFEQERGHAPSAVECYINQYGASAQVAYDEFYKQINNAWKDINEEFLKPTAVSKSALDRVLNLARVIDLLYKDEDAYTHVGESAKTSITMLLIDPITV